jgi:hypothetical protein
MNSAILVETGGGVNCYIKLLTSSALRKFLFNLFFIVFGDIDTYDSKLNTLT